MATSLRSRRLTRLWGYFQRTAALQKVRDNCQNWSWTKRRLLYTTSARIYEALFPPPSALATRIYKPCLGKLILMRNRPYTCHHKDRGVRAILLEDLLVCPRGTVDADTCTHYQQVRIYDCHHLNVVSTTSKSPIMYALASWRLWLPIAVIYINDVYYHRKLYVRRPPCGVPGSITTSKSCVVVICWHSSKILRRKGGSLVLMYSFADRSSSSNNSSVGKLLVFPYERTLLL